MTNFYNAYKPLRNFVRRFELASSLYEIWRYSQFPMHELTQLRNNSLFQKSQEAPFISEVFPWELETMVREIIMHSGNSGSLSLSDRHSFTKFVKLIRAVDNEAFKFRSDESDIMHEMIRIAYRQFPWQHEDLANPLLRTMKIFGSAKINSLIEHEFGIDITRFIHLSMAIYQNFRVRWGMTSSSDYNTLGISLDASQFFFRRFSAPMHDIRTKVLSAQHYDGDWVYAWNPLEATPLIQYDPAHTDRVICPIPRFFWRRVTSGLFYDLVDKLGFDNSFGKAFETYVGEVLHLVCSKSKFCIRAEMPYYVRGNKHHGVDYIVSDQSAHLFIEVKTKRLTVASKVNSDPAALKKDLKIFAKAVFQTYQNIQDARLGLTQWVDDGNPIFPVILYLEDVYFISPTAYEIIDGEVLELLSAAGLPNSILGEIPYTITSISDFELVIQVTASKDISSVWAAKTQRQYRPWNLRVFANDKFLPEVKMVKKSLFADDLQRLEIPSLRK